MFETKDMEYVAELLGQVAFDPALRARVIDRQRERLRDFSDDRLAARLKSAIETAAAP